MATIKGTVNKNFSISASAATVESGTFQFDGIAHWESGGYSTSNFGQWYMHIGTNENTFPPLGEAQRSTIIGGSTYNVDPIAFTMATPASGTAGLDITSGGRRYNLSAIPYDAVIVPSDGSKRVSFVQSGIDIFQIGSTFYPMPTFRSQTIPPSIVQGNYAMQISSFPVSDPASGQQWLTVEAIDDWPLFPFPSQAYLDNATTTPPDGINIRVISITQQIASSSLPYHMTGIINIAVDGAYSRGDLPAQMVGCVWQNKPSNALVARFTTSTPIEWNEGGQNPWQGTATLTFEIPSAMILEKGMSVILQIGFPEYW